MYWLLEQSCGVGIRQPLGFGNGLEGQVAVVGVQTLHQSGVGLAGGLGAQLRDLQSVGQGGAGEGKGGGSGDRAGHVGHGVMQNAVLDEVRISVGCDTVDGLDGAALVDGNIHQHTAGTHGLDHFLGDQLGSLGTGDQHAADDQVCVFNRPGDIVGVGQHGLDPAAEDIVQVGQPLGADVQDGDGGTHTGGNLGGSKE